MPFIIQYLIPDPQNLVTVTEDDSAQYALSMMVEHDFSQLPVTDSSQKLKGMITSDSILQVVSHLKLIPQSLKVSHAITKVKPYREEDELFELLKGLKDISAVPIVDKYGVVTAIVTSYDTAEYFRKRAEDIMLAEDIEVTLRDLIESSHRGEDGEIDETSLSQTIQSITPSGREHKNKFKSALLSYIAQTTGKNPQPDSDVIDQAFKKYLEQPTTPKTFDELTLNDFIQIFKNLWEKHSADFRDLKWESIHHLLDDVRITRNAIAHFREVTPQQRRQLRFCAEFLDNHRPSIEIPAAESAHFANINNIKELAISKGFPALSNAISGWLEERQHDISNLSNPSDELPNFDSREEEELEANDSRYAPLAVWLQKQEGDRITCTFDEVAAIIQDELPPSARQHRNWWANDAVSHVQSIQWLEVGWRVSSVNMSAERVVFSRMGDRQSAYIDFFSQLQVKLQSVEGLSTTAQNNHQGRHWISLAVAPKNKYDCQPLYLGFVFARRSRVRIEIYINESERGQNKQIFDQLQRQATEIEAEFGAALNWERLNHRHGCRIAYYRPESSITDGPEKLASIQDWVFEMLPKFYAALADRFATARKETHQVEDIAIIGPPLHSEQAAPVND